MAPLKSVGRAVIKSLEKYTGDFSRLTDLARCTFECKTLTQALAVLEALAAAAGWEILLIKNRLNLSFNADDQGGYRDLLLNLRRTEGEQEGHVIEVQISLVRLLQVKTGGGHANYQVARKLKLNEEAVHQLLGREKRDRSGQRAGIRYHMRSIRQCLEKGRRTVKPA